MADKKISQLTALSAANLAPSTDVLAIVDTSATETKKIVAQDLINGVLNVASAVGIGTSSPSAKLEVVGGVNVVGSTSLQLQRPVVASFDGQGAPAVAWQFYSTGTTYTTGAYIQGLADAAWSSTSAPMSLRFYTCPSGSTSTQERARITSGGVFQIANGGSIKLDTTASGNGNISFDGSTFTIVSNSSSASLVFSTNSTERARITSDGALLVGTTSTGGNSRLRVVNSNNQSGDFLIAGALGANAINTSSYQYIGSQISGADNVYIYGNGNIVNTNNSYGTLSDVKLKQDIIDAASQWDDVKAFKFRKFRFKEEVSRNPDAPHQLGLIAQELEQTSPGLVDTTPDRQNEGETMKTIKTSVLLMKATKALQEAMARIESLEAKVAALEAK